MSGPYAEGWRLENPDDPDTRRVVAVELPHVLVSDELAKQARETFYAQLHADEANPDKAIDAALSAVAGELWQAGYDAASKLQGGGLSCPQCARMTVGRRTDGKLACPFCGWMS